MADVTFNGKTYFSYASVAQADDYIAPTEYGEIWGVLTEDQKAGYLIQATRFLDSLPWKKECGETQQDRENNPNIVQACMEIAAQLASGATDIISGGSSEGGIQTLKAGSAQLSYFQKKSWQLGSGAVSTLIDGLPSSIAALIIDCLNVRSKTLIGISKSYGTCESSTLKESWRID